MKAGLGPISGLRPLALVRVTVGVLLGIHGAHRALFGGVAPFGEFLGSQGFPFGAVIAWTITLFELVASLALIVSRFVLPACAGFATILVFGIVMVHAPNGWFVVGAGRNGVEFSVLLIACLAALALDAMSRRRDDSALS